MLLESRNDSLYYALDYRYQKVDDKTDTQTVVLDWSAPQALLGASVVIARGLRLYGGGGYGYGYYPAPPPPVVYAPPCPGPGYYWVPGYWYRVGPRSLWRAGYWAPPAYIGVYRSGPRHYHRHGKAYRRW